MKKFKIKNFNYIVEKEENWTDYDEMYWLCGVVLNSDNEDFFIPIICKKDTKGVPVNPIPSFMGKSTKNIFTKEAYKNSPWIIKCNYNDMIDLINGNSECKVFLYHEIGHYYYDDGTVVEDEEKLRYKYLEQDKVAPEELKADEFACEILGKDEVLKALNKLLSSITMNPSLSEQYAAQFVTKELKLRIKAII